MPVTADADLIVNRGRGPEFAGARLPVDDVMDYLKHGWHRDRIVALLRVTEGDDIACQRFSESARTALCSSARIAVSPSISM